MSSASRTHRMLLRLARKGASSSSTIVEASNRTSTSISATTTARQGAVEDGGGGEGRFRLTPLDCGIYSHSGSNLCVALVLGKDAPPAWRLRTALMRVISKYGFEPLLGRLERVHASSTYQNDNDHPSSGSTVFRSPLFDLVDSNAGFPWEERTEVISTKINEKDGEEIINPDTLTVDLAHKRGWLPIIEHSGVAAGQTAPIAIRLTQIEEERPIESEQKEQEEEEILRGRSAHDGTYGTRQSDNASSSPASPSSSSVSSSSSASTSTTRILGVCMHRLIGDEVSLGVFLRAWAKECESKEHMTDKNCVNEETGGVSGFLHNRWQDSEMSDFFPPVVSFGENRPFLVSYDRTNAMHTIGKDDGRLMQHGAEEASRWQAYFRGEGTMPRGKGADEIDEGYSSSISSTIGRITKGFREGSEETDVRAAVDSGDDGTSQGRSVDGLNDRPSDMASLSSSSLKDWERDANATCEPSESIEITDGLRFRYFSSLAMDTTRGPISLSLSTDALKSMHHSAVASSSSSFSSSSTGSTTNGNDVSSSSSSSLSQSLPSLSSSLPTVISHLWSVTRELHHRGSTGFENLPLSVALDARIGLDPKDSEVENDGNAKEMEHANVIGTTESTRGQTNESSCAQPNQQQAAGSFGHESFTFANLSADLLIDRPSELCREINRIVFVPKSTSTTSSNAQRLHTRETTPSDNESTGESGMAYRRRLLEKQFERRNARTAKDLLQSLPPVCMHVVDWRSILPVSSLRGITGDNGRRGGERGDGSPESSNPCTFLDGVGLTAGTYPILPWETHILEQGSEYAGHGPIDTSESEQEGKRSRQSERSRVVLSVPRNLASEVASLLKNP